MGSMRKLILRNFQSPGDIVMLTAAVRDLHRTYPGEFITDVRTPFPGLSMPTRRQTRTGRIRSRRTAGRFASACAGRSGRNSRRLAISRRIQERREGVSEADILSASA